MKKGEELVLPSDFCVWLEGVLSVARTIPDISQIDVLELIQNKLGSVDTCRQNQSNHPDLTKPPYTITYRDGGFGDFTSDKSSKE